MRTREFIVSALIVSGLAIPATAFAMQQDLTSTEKSDIFTRCHKAGGSGKVCCAAASGTWKPDPQGNGGICTFTADLRGKSGASAKAPNNLSVAPSP